MLDLSIIIAKSRIARKEIGISRLKSIRRQIPDFISSLCCSNSYDKLVHYKDTYKNKMRFIFAVKISAILQWSSKNWHILGSTNFTKMCHFLDGFFRKFREFLKMCQFLNSQVL